MIKGNSFNNEVIDANARATNAGGISEAQDDANSLYSRINGASFEFVPSSYKENTVYAGTGVNGDLTFTRGGDAWRTNGQGLIQRVPWNLIQQSQTLNASPWTMFTGPAVTPNSTTAPDGTSTADTINSSGGGNDFLYQTSTLTTGITYTISFYVKNLNSSTSTIWTNNAEIFNINWSGSTLTSISSPGVFSLIGNGWYRVSATFTYTGSANNNRIYPDSANTSKSIYVWGYQLVEGTTPQTYLPTTDRLNVPRLDYSYGSSPSLLLEPQRTNLFLWSGQLSDASWSKQNCTITANSSISPDGTQTASLVDDGIAASTQHWFYQNPGFVYSTTYTISFYAKYVSRKYMSVNIYNGVTSQYVDYDIQNGTVFGATGDVTASIISVGNGWYRVAYTRTIAASGSPNLRIALADDTANETYTGSNKQVLIWGAQFEVGAYPSSYIGTTTASATRLVDTFTRNNIYANNLISVSGGTWFAQFLNNVDYIRDGSGDRGLFLDTSNTGNTNGFQFVHRGGVSTQRIIINKRVSGLDTIVYQSSVAIIKIAIKWNGTTADIFANGTKVVTATSFTTTAMGFLNFTSDGAPFFIQQMALFPTPISDADCISLTADYTDGTSITNIYEQYVNNLGGTVENLNGVTNLIQNLR
jgi:hypothetical protein